MDITDTKQSVDPNTISVGTQVAKAYQLQASLLLRLLNLIQSCSFGEQSGGRVSGYKAATRLQKCLSTLAISHIHCSVLFFHGHTKC